MSDDKDNEKKKSAEEAARYSGIKKPEDPELVEWMMMLWKNGEKPELIDIAQVFGKKELIFGNVVDRETFSTLSQMNQEAAVNLSNRFLGAAIRDCTRMIRKPQTYYVRAMNSSSGAEPIANFPLYITPRTSALTLRDPGATSIMRGGDSDSVDDGDNLPKADRVALAYIKQMVEAGQFDKAHYASTFGDLLIMSRDREKQLYSWIADLMGMNKGLFVEVMAALRAQEAALRDAESREIDRDMRRLKMDLLKDGVRTGRNLLTGLFGERMAAAAAAKQQPSNGNGHDQGSDASSKPKTEEQILLDNFFHDVEATGISVALFGDWKQTNGSEPEQVSPGIFSKEQLILLMKVRSGIAPAAALDELDPESGRPLAVTFEQINKAQEVMSEGTAMGLLQLFNLRKRKRAPAAPPPVAATPNTQKEGYDV